MFKPTLLILCLIAWSPLAGLATTGGSAQNKARKPTEALRQISAQQRKLLEEAASAQEKASAPSALNLEVERERRLDQLRLVARERAALFSLKDWQDEELLALALLYESGELFDEAAAAYRALLNTSNLNPRDAAKIKGQLATALLNAGNLREARPLIQALQREPLWNMRENQIVRFRLLTDLALALRQRDQTNDALQIAFEAYEMTKEGNWRGGESFDQNRTRLAALLVASLERLGRAKEAEALQQRLRKEDFAAPASTPSQTTPSQAWELYETELVTARLIGKPAQDLLAARWLDLPVAFAALRGKVVLLDFWAMWCTSGFTAFPHYRAWLTQYAPKGFAIIGVTKFYGRSDTQDNLNREQEWQVMQAFKRKHQLDWPIVVGKLDDITNDERYGIAQLPSVVLIDRRGIIRDIQRMADNRRAIERQLARLLDEK